MEQTKHPPVNPAGKSRSNRTKNALIALALILLIAGLYILGLHNYPLFHSFADMITVFIAASVFVVVWNGRRFLDNHYYLFVGIAFLFFAFLDFMHLLGNKGMGVFPQYGNLGPTFYIASRYVLSLSFLLAPWFITRKLKVRYALAGYLLAIALILLSVFYWHNFPATYIEGEGLTRFKVISDYIICALLAGAIALLLIYRRGFDPKVLRLIIFSLILSIATGLAFALYTDPFGITNSVGHFFQIASFYLVYRAFIQTALTQPQDILYRNLRQNREEVLKLNAALERANLDLKQDITERKKAAEALRQSEVKLRRLYDSGIVGVIYFKLEGKITEANDKFLEMLGYTREDLKEDRIDWVNMTPPEFRHLDESSVRELKATGVNRVPFEKEYIRKDGTRIPILVTGAMIDDTRLNGAAFVLDITRIKEAEEALRRYALDLESANKELESFSYTVSHDLRAPLRTLHGFSTALLEDYSEKLDDQGKKWLENLRTASLHMGRLIDDILRLSRVIRAEVKLETVNLSEIAQSQAEKLKETEPERKVEFVITPGLEAPGDSNLLNLVLQNLLGNAFKFTSRTRSARIEFGSIPQNGNTVYFVRDNGAGFDMRYAEKLFQPFQRLHSEKEYSGNGIGLATVLRIVQRHGGKVWAEGEVNRGATFYFTLAKEGK
jgi:PAS domain S-box-containing protein